MIIFKSKSILVDMLSCVLWCMSVCVDTYFSIGSIAIRLITGIFGGDMGGDVIVGAGRYVD